MDPEGTAVIVHVLARTPALDANTVQFKQNFIAKDLVA